MSCQLDADLTDMKIAFASLHHHEALVGSCPLYSGAFQQC